MIPPSNPGDRPDGRRFTFVRHGESTFNVLGLLNGDPSVHVPLTALGRAQAEAAARELSAVDFDATGHSGFPRTRETLEILSSGRALPPATVYPELGDVHVGIFEGAQLTDYRDWRHDHGPAQAPPGGESRIEVLARFLDGFGRLLDRPGSEVLTVTHDVPIRFLANALAGDDPLDGRITRVRNAEIRVFGLGDMEAALGAMKRRLARG